tara:strand:- start:1395 stop:2711 length:1317 start_codon:yes stop_codon:yes gene_type:complete
MKFEDQKDNPAFCILPFIHTHVGPEGKVHLCCMAEWNNPIAMNVKGAGGLKELWSGERYQDARRRMLNGEKIPVCRKCWRADATGGGSDRATFNKGYGDIVKMKYPDMTLDIEKGNSLGTPIIADLRPGNFCNLKCRMCYPGSSSVIGDDCIEHPIEINTPFYGINVETFGTKQTWEDYDWIEDKDTYSEVEDLLPNLRILKIVGGEPLFMPHVIKLLKHCVDTGISKKIILDLTTNGTRRRGKVFNMLTQFRELILNVSIDGTGPAHDYIRFPSTIKEVAQNFEDYTKELIHHGRQYRAQTNILMTVQLYNIFEIANIIDYWKKTQIEEFAYDQILTFNMVEHPDCFDARLLPFEYKMQVKKDIEDVCNKWNVSEFDMERTRINNILHDLSLPANDNIDLQKKFVERTRTYDRIRNQNIAEVDDRLKIIFDEWSKHE